MGVETGNLAKAATTVALMGLIGCGGPLGAARSEFDAGHYAEARQTLVAAGPMRDAWSAERRAEYALYRGLAHGALGDLPQAVTWLRQARALETARPGTLCPDDERRLAQALRAYMVTP